MNPRTLPVFAFIALAAAPAPAAVDTAAGVRDLYSEKPEVRAAAAERLSAAAPGAEAAAVIAAFRAELNCSGKKPAPRGCRDAAFLREMIGVAGTLAKKDSAAPWDFLVWLGYGRTSTDGSFFDKPGDMREDGYYSPPAGGAGRAALQARLDDAIGKAGIIPSCSWPKEKIEKLAGKPQVLGAYRLYSYRRYYSGADISEEYRISHALAWAFDGHKQAYCGPDARLADFGAAGVLAVSASQGLSEELDYSVRALSLKTGAKVCAYTVTLGPDAPDPGEAGPDVIFKTFFSFDGKACSPKKVKDCTFVPED